MSEEVAEDTGAGFNHDDESNVENWKTKLSSIFNEDEIFFLCLYLVSSI